MTSRISPRVSLVIIAALFIVPLAAAWMMYSGIIDYRPASTRNQGMLVEPPRPIDWGEAAGEFDADALLSHWVILHVVGQECAPGCLEAVAALRQVHRAAGRNQQRIRLVLLLPYSSSAKTREQLSAIYGSFELLTDPPGRIWATASEIAAPAPGPEGASYLVDPLGNIMMYYEAGSDPNKLKKDLKRLLTWSKLDEQ